MFTIHLWSTLFISAQWPSFSVSYQFRNSNLWHLHFLSVHRVTRAWSCPGCPSNRPQLRLVESLCQCFFVGVKWRQIRLFLSMSRMMWPLNFSPSIWSFVNLLCCQDRERGGQGVVCGGMEEGQDYRASLFLEATYLCSDCLIRPEILTSTRDSHQPI